MTLHCIVLNKHCQIHSLPFYVDYFLQYQYQNIKYLWVPMITYRLVTKINEEIHVEIGKLLWVREFICCSQRARCSHRAAVVVERIHGGRMWERHHGVDSFFALIEGTYWITLHYLSSLLQLVFGRLAYTDFNTKAEMEGSSKRGRTKWERGVRIGAGFPYIPNLLPTQNGDM